MKTLTRRSRERGAALILAVTVIVIVFMFVQILASEPEAAMAQARASSSKSESLAAADAGVRDAVVYLNGLYQNSSSSFSGTGALAVGGAGVYTGGTSASSPTLTPSSQTVYARYGSASNDSYGYPAQGYAYKIKTLTSSSGTYYFQIDAWGWAPGAGSSRTYNAQANLMASLSSAMLAKTVTGQSMPTGKLTPEINPVNGVTRLQVIIQGTAPTYPPSSFTPAMFTSAPNTSPSFGDYGTANANNGSIVGGGNGPGAPNVNGADAGTTTPTDTYGLVLQNSGIQIGSGNTAGFDAYGVSASSSPALASSNPTLTDGSVIQTQSGGTLSTAQTTENTKVSTMASIVQQLVTQVETATSNGTQSSTGITIVNTPGSTNTTNYNVGSTAGIYYYPIPPGATVSGPLFKQTGNGQGIVIIDVGVGTAVSNNAYVDFSALSGNNNNNNGLFRFTGVHTFNGTVIFYQHVPVNLGTNNSLGIGWVNGGGNNNNKFQFNSDAISSALSNFHPSGSMTFKIAQYAVKN